MPTKRKAKIQTKRKIKERLKLGKIQAMTVRPETRADMASAWVRELAKQEIRNMLMPMRMEISSAIGDLKKAIAEVVTAQEKLRAQMKDLEKRAGDFTGLSEAQVSGMISRMVNARVTAQVTRMTIDEMFREVIGKYYGSSTHPAFRARFRFDDPRIEKYLHNERQEDVSSQGSD